MKHNGKTLLIMFFSAFILVGCGSAENRKLGSEQIIPENGIIDTELLKQIKEDNLVTVFRGTSNGYSYEWTVFGSEIQKTEDMNLLADITISDNNITEVSLYGNDNLFSSVLSIHTGRDLRGIHFEAFRTDNDKEVKLPTVTVTGNEDSILNFSPGSLHGKISIKPDNSIKNSKTEISAVSPEITPQKKTKIKAETVQTDNIASGSPALSETLNSITENNENTSISEHEEIKTSVMNTSESTELNDEKSNEEINTCSILIECTSVFSNLSKLEPGIIDTIPSDGIILEQAKETFTEGETVFDILKRLCAEKKIHIDFEWVPVYNSSYVSAINNLYEFDCSNLSGWLYSVNGWFPNYGPSCYEVKNNDIIEWRYTCDLGKDVNGGTTVRQYE